MHCGGKAQTEEIEARTVLVLVLQTYTNLSRGEGRRKEGGEVERQVL
jgi:hypothetical protein